MMGISIWQLLIILAIIIVLFGTKKLRNMGSDLGGAVNNFKSAMKDPEEGADKLSDDSGDVIDAESSHKQEHKS